MPSQVFGWSQVLFELSARNFSGTQAYAQGRLAARLGGFDGGKCSAAATIAPRVGPSVFRAAPRPASVRVFDRPSGSRERPLSGAGILRTRALGDAIRSANVPQLTQVYPETHSPREAAAHGTVAPVQVAAISRRIPFRNPHAGSYVKEELRWLTLRGHRRYRPVGSTG
jgi:hypothetical protein